MAKTGVLLENDAAATANRVKNLRTELRKLVNAIVEDEDCRGETFDRAADTVFALKDLKFKKFPNFPDHFKCPLSNELMRDPVIVATGQTYERQYIQARLEAGSRTCPKTQQVLSHSNLIPNNLIREMITQWCETHGMSPPNPANSIHEQAVTIGEKDRFTSLLKKVQSSPLNEQREAAKELRSLTKRMPSFRSLFCQNRDAIPQLLHPLSMSKTYCPSDLQEDLVTTVLNLSILDDNKKLLAETSQAIPLLIDCLKSGTIETRTNAAAALFSLSALDSNKSSIGLYGALKPLIDVLEEGHQLAMKDAASAIYSLCITPENKARAVRDGAVKVIMQKIKDRVFVDELLTILVMLSSHERAVEEMIDLGAVPVLLSIIRESNCERNREHSISILCRICDNDRSKLREMKEEERANRTISELAETGSMRARRKASSILQRINRSGAFTH